MLDTIDARLAEARAGTLGHAEFLQVLCEDELARRDAAKITRRIKAARFPEQATLESFDFGYNPKLPAAQIRDLARLEFIPAGEGLIAYGPVGVGKSHLAGGHADRSFEARVRKLAKTAVLICDDFAMREFTAAQADDLYELLTERIGRPGRSLILTSNRSPADWYPLFPNAIVGESILDRVLNTSHHLLLEGKSYRPRRRPASTSPAPPRRARHDQKGGGFAAAHPRRCCRVPGRGTRRARVRGRPLQPKRDCRRQDNEYRWKCPGERTREVTLGLEPLPAPRPGSKGQARRPALPRARRVR